MFFGLGHDKSLSTITTLEATTSRHQKCLIYTLCNYAWLDYTPFTRHNRFDVCLHDATGVVPLSKRLDNQLYCVNGVLRQQNGTGYWRQRATPLPLEILWWMKKEWSQWVWALSLDGIHPFCLLLFSDTVGWQEGHPAHKIAFATFPQRLPSGTREGTRKKSVREPANPHWPGKSLLKWR